MPHHRSCRHHHLKPPVRRGYHWHQQTKPCRCPRNRWTANRPRAIGRASPGSKPSDPEHLGWSRRSTAVTLAVLLVIGTVAFWYINRDNLVALEVDGRAIANAETVLDRSEAAFAALVKADGATPADRAGCWFAPAPDKSIGARGPQVACGPVLLGVSGTSKPWVLGTVDYSTGSGGGATGAFDSFKAVGDPDTGAFARPDGRGVPSTSDLKPATEGVRAEDGRLLVGAQAMIDEADDAFAVAAEKAGASVAKDSACFFGGTKNKAGQFLTDGELWCGPVLLLDSDPPDVWSRWTFSVGSGDTFAFAEPSTPSIVSLTRTLSLDPGVDLVRPDGRRTPDGAGLAPPDAEPIEDGVLVVVDKLPGDVRAHQARRWAIDHPVPTVSAHRLGPGRKGRLRPRGTGGGHGPLPGRGHLRSCPGQGWPLRPGHRATGGRRRQGSVYQVELTRQFRCAGVVGAGLRRAGGARGALRRCSSTDLAPHRAASRGISCRSLSPGHQHRSGGASRCYCGPAGRRSGIRGGCDQRGTAGGVDRQAGLGAGGHGVPGRHHRGVEDDPTVLRCEGTEDDADVWGHARRRGAVEGVAAASTSRPDPVFVVPAGFTVGSLELRLHVTFELGGAPRAVDGEPVRLTVALPA